MAYKMNGKRVIGFDRDPVITGKRGVALFDRELYVLQELFLDVGQ
jgi:hypothetical protein